MSEPYPGYFEGAEPPDLGCPLPAENGKPDWYCSLEPGHDGPCPMRPRPTAPHANAFRFAQSKFSRPTWTPADQPTLYPGPSFFERQATADHMLEKLTRLTSDAVAAEREKNITLFFKPRPWWLPRFLHHYLLRRLTTVVFFQNPPITGPVIQINGYGQTGFGKTVDHPSGAANTTTTYPYTWTGGAQQ